MAILALRKMFDIVFLVFALLAVVLSKPYTEDKHLAVKGDFEFTDHLVLPQLQKKEHVKNDFKNVETKPVLSSKIGSSISETDETVNKRQGKDQMLIITPSENEVIKTDFKEDSKVALDQKAKPNEPLKAKSDVLTEKVKTDGNLKGDNTFDYKNTKNAPEESSKIPLTIKPDGKNEILNLNSKVRQTTEEKDGNSKFEYINTKKVPEESSKIPLIAKPDGKDEILNLNLKVSQTTEEKDGGLPIGRFPLFLPLPLMHRSLPSLLPFSNPLQENIPPIAPLPPTVQISDRLPIPETDFSKEISQAPEGTADGYTSNFEQRWFSDILGPLLHLLSLKEPPSTLMSYLPDTQNRSEDFEKLPSVKKSKTVDMQGKKFVMTSKMSEMPINGKDRFFFRFISLRPLSSDLNSTMNETTVKAENGKEELKKNKNEEEMEEMKRKKSEGRTQSPYSTKDELIHEASDGIKPKEIMFKSIKDHRKSESDNILKTNKVLGQNVAESNILKKDLSNFLNKKQLGLVKPVEADIVKTEESQNIFGEIMSNKTGLETKQGAIPLEGDVTPLVIKEFALKETTAPNNSSDKDGLLEKSEKMSENSSGESKPEKKESPSPTKNIAVNNNIASTFQTPDIVGGETHVDQMDVNHKDLKGKDNDSKLEDLKEIQQGVNVSTVTNKPQNTVVNTKMAETNASKAEIIV